MAELAFHRILIRDNMISEVDGQPIVTIQRADIVRIRLAHGRLAAQPWLFLFGGALLVLIGIAGVYLVADVLVKPAFHRGGFPKTGALALLGLIAGPFLARAGLERGPYLEVHTKRGVRRLLFGNELEIERLPSFVERAREIGVEIELPAPTGSVPATA